MYMYVHVQYSKFSVYAVIVHVYMYMYVHVCVCYDMKCKTVLWHYDLNLSTNTILSPTNRASMHDRLSRHVGYVQHTCMIPALIVLSHWIEMQPSNNNSSFHLWFYSLSGVEGSPCRATLQWCIHEQCASEEGPGLGQLHVLIPAHIAHTLALSSYLPCIMDVHTCNYCTLDCLAH